MSGTNGTLNWSGKEERRKERGERERERAGRSEEGGQEMEPFSRNDGFVVVFVLVFFFYLSTPFSLSIHSSPSHCLPPKTTITTSQPASRIAAIL